MERIPQCTHTKRLRALGNTFCVQCGAVLIASLPGVRERWRELWKTSEEIVTVLSLTGVLPATDKDFEEFHRGQKITPAGAKVMDRWLTSFADREKVSL